MLNPITFQIDEGSGPLVVTASGLDFAAYEDTFDKPAISGIVEGRYKCWMFLAWSAMSREGKTSETFDEFLSKTPTLERPEKVEDLPPLESPALTGSPSTSPTSSD